MVYDLVVIGGGPAGIQAAIYAASEGMKVLVVEKGKVGGQIGQTPLLENWIGAGTGITGPAFAEQMRQQALHMGATIQEGEVLRMWANFDVDAPRIVRVVTSTSVLDIPTFTVVIATGNSWQGLSIPGVRHGVGKSVHYGPLQCLDAECEGREVAVYGGGPSAGQAIVELSKRAKTVHVIMRSTMRMPMYLENEIIGKPNCPIYNHSRIEQVITHRDRTATVKWIQKEDSGDQQQFSAEVQSLFMCSGLVPATKWLAHSGVKLNEAGKVLTGKAVGRESHLETSMAGVFAIGDCRAGSTPRVGAAIGDGASVVSELWNYFIKNPVCSTCQA